MQLSKEVIYSAYRHLKSYAYHENLNLYLKQRVAEFECNTFEVRLEEIKNLLNSENPLQSHEFQTWLKSIDYHILPKSISRPEDATQNEHNKKYGLFISNVTTADKYQISKVNYFINAPIELHIIEILWCLTVAPLIEQKLTKDCYGNRMHDSAIKFMANTKQEAPASSEIFKRYIDQYNSWRDQAINTATELSKNNEDVALLSLDLKSYFYHIDIDFEEIKSLIDSEINDTDMHALSNTLTDALQHIHVAYKEKTTPRYL